MRTLLLCFVCLLCLLGLSACEDKLLQPSIYTPQGPAHMPQFNREVLLDASGSCYTGYRNLNIRSDRITLSWNLSTAETGLRYKLYRGNYLLSSFSGNTASFTDSLLSSNYHYNYVLAAISPTGLSKLDTLSIKTACIAPPILSSRINSARQVILYWTDPSDIPGAFHVYKGGTLLRTIDEVLPATHDHLYSILDSNVSEYSSYDYEVQKVGQTEQTDLSNPLLVTVSYNLTPPYLSSLQQGENPEGEPTVMLLWSESSSAETGFKIYRKLEGESSFTALATLTTPNQTSYTDEQGLQMGNTYQYMLSAIDTESSPPQESAFSNIQSITIQEDTGAVWQVALLDEYGDGWDNARLTITVNNLPVLSNITLSDGYGPAFFNIPVRHGDQIRTIYNPGIYAQENYYAILDHYGNIVAQSGGEWYYPGWSVPSSISTPIIVNLGGKSNSSAFMLEGK